MDTVNLVILWENFICVMYLFCLFFFFFLPVFFSVELCFYNAKNVWFFNGAGVNN